MIRTYSTRLSLILCFSVIYLGLSAQVTPVIDLVNPFIGTSNTQTATLWGSEGGTYPGAVAPFGYVQLTPETRITDPKGYNYQDSSIYFFSCIKHPTGYPDGSSGKIHVMAAEEGKTIVTGKYNRPFSHKDEVATPGYYRVLFTDNGTMIEVTATERTGMFRFTFAPNIKPRILLSDLGKIESISGRVLSSDTSHAIMSFSADFIGKEEIKGGCILSFPAGEPGKNTLIMKIGVSTVDFESTLNNLHAEADTWDFDQLKLQNQQKWNKALSVISVEDSSKTNKTIFYTALYHSLLMPWIISDTQGKYMGADKLIHTTKGKNQYAGFSAWDTFRSLHPLLCLIAPGRQQDMVLSMLDRFEQSGLLPTDLMTANHIIPVIVDTYLKGICGFDKALAYKAMKSCLGTASGSVDFSAYRQLGYVPSSLSESVTKSVEFAYDDWALAQFAELVMEDHTEAAKLLNRSFNYRNLFNPEVMAMLPRLGTNFTLNPGNTGYKEGDHWSYSMFVPQNPLDLINLFGGNSEFVAHLDSALKNRLILFDNEPVEHVPYLFNYANRQDLTQQWVRNLMKTHYTNSPWGLPGNDDHGAMSSWYVFSAMGFFPTCPGKPIYDLGSPLFKKVTVQLQNGKKWIINSTNNGAENLFVHNTLLNGQAYNKPWIEHSSIAQGGEITFEMDKIPPPNPESYPAHPSETQKLPEFHLAGFEQSQKQVAPDQLFFVHFILQNYGSKGTKVVKLFIDGKEYNRKNLLVNENSTVADSIGCRLYAAGEHMIRIDQLEEHNVEVITPKKGSPSIQVIELKSLKIFKLNTPVTYQFMLQNKGSNKSRASIPVALDDSVCREEIVTLEPGETKTVEKAILFKTTGLHKLQVGAKINNIKIYDENIDSKIIDINLDVKVVGETLIDQSKLLNHGLAHHQNDDNQTPFQGILTNYESYAEFPGNETIDQLDEKITVMAWIKPALARGSLSDIITKGDFIALQTSENKTISWFAGGWGRGSCSASLPDNWIDNWHHIAGVANGKVLKLYIDGIESGSITLDKTANLSCQARWMIGRNEEFPDQRFFNGYVNHFKIFVEPLTNEEIKSEMLKDSPKIEY